MNLELINKIKGYIVIPYIQGLCVSIIHICDRYDIQSYFKGNTTLKNLLLTPKDQDQIQEKSLLNTGANATEWTVVIT